MWTQENLTEASVGFPVNGQPLSESRDNTTVGGFATGFLIPVPLKDSDITASDKVFKHFFIPLENSLCELIHALGKSHANDLSSPAPFPVSLRCGLMISFERLHTSDAIVFGCGCLCGLPK